MTLKKLLALSIAVAALASGAPAHATATLTVTVFGDRRVNEADTPYDDAKVLFANSSPDGIGPTGLLHIRGTTEPGAPVAIEATDGATILRTTATGAASDGSDGAGRGAGEFETTMNITDLGTHYAGTNGSCAISPPPASCDPMSTDPNDWGPSTIDVTVSVAGATPYTTQITKFAGTPYDKYTPQFDIRSSTTESAHNFPPCNWIQIEPYELYNGRGVGDACGHAWRDGNGHSYAEVSGGLRDDIKTFGIASEIADIRIDVQDANFDSVLTTHNITRQGPIGSYGWILYAIRLQPDVQHPYTITVTARDAWGNLDPSGADPSLTSSFRLYPI